MTPLKMLLKEEEQAEVNTKVVAEHRCQKLSGKDWTYTSSWSKQNRGHIQRSDLAEINKEEKTKYLRQEIRDCIHSGYMI